MRRLRFIWPAASLASAAAAFLGVRSVLQETGKPEAHAPPPPPSGAALEAALREPDHLLRRLHFLDLIEKADPAALREIFLGDLATPDEKMSALRRWAGTDPAGVFAFLKGINRQAWAERLASLDPAVEILFASWAAQDPDAALAAFTSVAHRPWFRSGLWSLMRTLLATDPARAFALAGQLPRGPGNAYPFPEALWKEDPATFLKAAATAQASVFANGEILDATAGAFTEFLRKDPAAAAAWLSARPVDQQRRLWGRLAACFAALDPAGARDWFSRTPPSASRELAGAEMVRAFAAKDPRAALDWLQDNLLGGRTRAFANLAEVLSTQGAESARQLLDAMPAGPQRDAVAAAVADTWLDRDFTSALQWVLALPGDDPARRKAMSHVIYRWPNRDLPAAAAYARDHSSTEDGRRLVWYVSNAFRSTDLTGGITWAASLPDDARQRVFSDFLFQTTAPNEKAQIVDAIAALPAAARESVAGGLATSLLNPGAPSDWDTRALTALKSLPPEVRPAARTAVQQSEKGTPARKQTVLDALK